MRKINKKNNAGYIDLNQARLKENENPRPTVTHNKKASANQNKSNKAKSESSKKLPTINKYSKKTNTVKNVKNSRHINNNGFIPRDENGKILITRRGLIYGAIGAGVLVAGGAGVKFASDKISKSNNPSNTLVVPKSNAISSDTLSEDNNIKFSVQNEIELPYGSLAWANSSNIITCLIPSDLAKPLSQVMLINIKNASTKTILEESVGLKSGFEIYDVRANDYGIIWTEVNILQGEWKIYASKFDNGFNINPILLDNGKKDWETPTICVNNNYVYWQVLPELNGNKNKMLSALKKQNLTNLKNCGDETAENANSNDDIKNNSFVVYTSNGRMCSPINCYDNGVIITPRANSGNIVYQLTYINNNDTVIDSLSLPQNMKPLEAGYGETGFNFAFDAIYNYGDGISNLGTYTPIEDTNGDYNNAKWLNFSRVPSASPAWCKNYFIVRSTMAICVIDLARQSYVVLDRPNASDDYGDFLASTGKCNKIVTYANIFDQPVSGENKKYCVLRIWDED